MFACSLPLLLGSRSVGPTATTRGPWATQTLPNASRAATQSRAGTQGRAASSRTPAQQRAPTAAGKARQGRSLRRGWPALLGKRRPEPHLELLSAKPLPWAATARREKPWAGGCHVLSFQQPRCAKVGGSFLLVGLGWALDPRFVGTNLWGQPEERSRQPRLS